MSNIGLRFVVELRDGNSYWWALTTGGTLHESARGYSTAVEALEQADLYRRLLKLDKWRAKEKEKRLAENQ
jgi:hypothetical protein